MTAYRIMLRCGWPDGRGPEKCFTFSNATKNQIPILIVLQCSEADSRLALSDENDRARLLERPGEAIYNTSNGRIEGNTRFQIAWLAEFDMRVALQMGAEDSRRLLDSEAATKLGPFRALFFDEERTGRLEKFRPYGLPSAEQIAEWGSRLRARG